MEEKINIAEILKDKPKGIRLYSPIFGECSFSFVREETNDICVKKHNGVKEFFDSKGLYYNTGEVMLFPSKEMRDWSKFFKKGDVLVSYEGNKPYYTIFDCFESNNYKDFNGKFAYDSYEEKWYQNEGNLSTNTFHKLSIADSEIYITKIEERFGGKMNHETLEIKNTHPEFKDGDILYVKTKKLGSEYIIINKLSKEAKTAFYVAYNLSSKKIFCNLTYFVCRDKEISILRQATNYEKSQLFDALAKKNKAWDSEKKAIVDLKQKVELKPFDKVLSRRCSKDYWVLNFYSHKTDYYHICIDGSSNLYCIPYNEETAHLLGTTDEWKGCDG